MIQTLGMVWEIWQRTQALIAERTGRSLMITRDPRAGVFTLAP